MFEGEKGSLVYELQSMQKYVRQMYAHGNRWALEVV